MTQSGLAGMGFFVIALLSSELAGRLAREEIAAIFGVPVSMLKANDPNLASATAGYAMWREIIGPYLVR